MRPYGKKKANRKGESHGDHCGICRPPTKNKKANGRRQAKKAIDDFAKENGLVVSEPVCFLGDEGPCQGCGGITICLCNDY